MRNELVSVEINRIQLDDISVKGVNPLETPIIAREVADKMNEIEEETGMVDTLKLALLAAMSFAGEMYVTRQEAEAARQSAIKQMDDMIIQLNSALSKSAKM